MPGPAGTIRRRFDLRGQVQGVGFRPYVYRIAMAHELAGTVANNSNGAVIEVEGPADVIDAFEHELVTSLPPLAQITELAHQDQDVLGVPGFRISLSQTNADQRPEVTPDAATCVDCQRELLDPADRRYRYAFTNCTNCGPRYSIIRGVPYDRPKTTMAPFEMCPPCQAEYDDPADRRFHAQPNACADCGPRLTLRRVVRAGGEAAESSSAPSRRFGEDRGVPLLLSSAQPSRVTQNTAQEQWHPAESPGQGSSYTVQTVPGDAIRETARLLHDGAIVAVKGIGGYHLACRADCEEVVARLRRRKLRDGKPLAVMVGSLEVAGRLCHLSPADVDALTSPAAPIVLAPRRSDDGLAESIAPGCRDLGLLLPYTPLHHLLFAEGLGPLVMTSANLAGQPLTYRDADAFDGLADTADAFLSHDREIFRPVDDSVVFTFRDEVVPIRRARGYAPRPLQLAGFESGPLAAIRERRILAVGGELKATVCLLYRGQAVLSEHVGDLTHPDTYRHYLRAIERLEELCGFEPDLVACDLHPQYLSTAYARGLSVPLVTVQHHHAHIASVMAEWGESGPLVGLSCDGMGLGPDNAVWGCEVLLCECGTYERLGHHEYFPLVGGDRAAIETWRPAGALLRAAGEQWADALSKRGCPGRQSRTASVSDRPDSRPTEDELRVFEKQAAGNVNAPPTSSLGRVFDAAAFLLGLCGRNRHEAEGAMALESAAGDQPQLVEPLDYRARERDGGVELSLVPTVAALVRESERGAPVGLLAARFHESAARMLADAAQLAAKRRGIKTVGLSGGCCANRRLLTRLVDLLESRGLRVLYHRRIPPGDGGLALGQALIAAWQA